MIVFLLNLKSLYFPYNSKKSCYRTPVLEIFVLPICEIPRTVRFMISNRFSMNAYREAPARELQSARKFVPTESTEVLKLQTR